MALVGAILCRYHYALLPYATTAVGVIAVQIFYGVVLNAVYPICFQLLPTRRLKDEVATSISFTTAALWLRGCPSPHYWEAGWLA